MRPKALVLILAAALAGCAAAPAGKPAWEMKPVMDVRHGMADAKAYFQLGRHQQDLGKLAAAEGFYEKALLADPESVDALNALATLYADRGDVERAAATFRRLVKLAPQRAYLYNNIGYAYSLQGRHAEAVAALQQAVALNPDYERAWVNLEAAARKAGMPGLAALAARRSLAELPVEPVADSAVSSPEPALQKTAPTPAAAAAGSSPASAAEAPAALPLPAVRPAAAPVPSAPPVRPQAISLREIPPRMAMAEAHAPAADATRHMIVFDPAPRQLPAAAVRAATPAPALPIAAVRIEVSNGNGINGFARQVRTRLQEDGLKVTRMTNFSSFAVRQTVIEYRSGFAAPAQELRERLGMPVTVVEAQADRRGSDVRVIIGRDWRSPAQVNAKNDRPLKGLSTNSPPDECGRDIRHAG